MRLTDRPARKRSETRDLTHPIIVALNKMPGVRVARNNTGMLEWAPGKRLKYGLGTGSADIVGMCRIPVLIGDIDLTTGIGRAFCLEVKWPGEHPDEDQIRWLRTVRSFGGFATVVHSIAEARAAVDRCRTGSSE